MDGDEAVDAKHTELVGAGDRTRRESFRTAFGAWVAIVDDPTGTRF